MTKQVVLIADNQDITAAGVAHLVSIQYPKASFSHIATKEKLIEALSHQESGIVILDYTLFDFAGEDNFLVICERFKTFHWLLFSTELSNSFLRRTLFSGYHMGAITKDCSANELEAAISSVFNLEQDYILPSIQEKLNNEPTEQLEKIALTTTERQVLCAIALGRSSKEIANDRHLSTHTIITHRKNIFRKLNVNNVHEATKCAIRMGLINLAEYYI